MAILRWFWGLKLRWRIPLASAVLITAVVGLYLLVAFARYRQCRHLDLPSLMPGRIPLVLRCRDGASHWGRVRQTDLYRIIEAQISRHGPAIEWIESATGRSWKDLTAPLTAGPAASRLTEARLRGLFGTDAIAGLDPSALSAAASPAVFLTRIGFLEYLAYPIARRAVAAYGNVPLERVRYRGVDLYVGRDPRADPSASAPPPAFAFALKGDILAVATDPDLLREVVDRTCRDWFTPDDVPTWVLPDTAALAAGIDLHRLPPVRPPGRGWREILNLVPLREVLIALDPDRLGRCTLSLDVGDRHLHVEAAVQLRPGAPPKAPIPPPAGNAPASLDAVPADAIAVLAHRMAFEDFWPFFEGKTLDASRETVAAEVTGNAWKLFQREAREVELPALRSSGLITHLLPRLRVGPTLAVVREDAAAVSGGAPPQTVVVLVETSGTRDGAENALRDLLRRRTAPLAAKRPPAVVETEQRVKEDVVHLLRRTDLPVPVQVAYGEARGILAVGVRSEAIVHVHETLMGDRPPLIRSARFRAVKDAIGRAAGGSPAPDVLTLAYVDLRRACELIREAAPTASLFAKDRIDGPALRLSLKQRNPRPSQEAPEAYEQRISDLYKADVKRVVDEARRRLEDPLKLLDLFSAAGLEVSVATEGFVIRGAVLIE